MQLRPVVHGLRRDLADVDFVQVDLTTAGGGDIARAYGVRYTPAFVVLDSTGATRHVVKPDYLVAAVTPAFRVLDADGRLQRRVPTLDRSTLAELLRPLLT